MSTNKKIEEGLLNLKTQAKAMICGIDEAGRGCIIGPMVIAVASISQLEEYKLKEMGVKDSKQLSPKRREDLYVQIMQICKVSTTHISAKEITELMDKYSLNEIEAIFISKLVKDTDAQTLFVDSPDNVPANFAKRIRKYLKGKKLKIVSENKADVNHPIVAAASVIAKVQRDAQIEKIKKEMGENFGSGYTSDPNTIEFLKKRLNDKELQPYLRHKWATLKRLGQKKISDF
ncbi:MAG: ribonuclease HII [Candidatus Micrarchaeia archaeon]